VFAILAFLLFSGLPYGLLKLHPSLPFFLISKLGARLVTRAVVLISFFAVSGSLVIAQCSKAVTGVKSGWG